MNNFCELKRKARKGFLSLLGRQIGINIVGLAGTVLLARLLSPSDFGVFSIAQFAVTFLSVFTDIGFGASLLRKKETITEKEIETFLATNLGITSFCALFLWLIAPYVVSFYDTLQESHTWLIRSLAVSFLISTLRCVPILLMEKELKFDKIALIDTSETLTYWLFALLLSALGYGIWALVVATFLRSVLGSVSAHRLRPIGLRPRIHAEIFSELIRFGGAYQLHTVLNHLKDTFLPIYIGTVLGATSLGYVNFAKNIVFKASSFTQILKRLLFPVLSNIQSDTEQTKNVIEKTIRLLAQIYFPLAASIIILFPPFVKYVVGPQWAPSIVISHFFAISMSFALTVMPLWQVITVFINPRGLLKYAILLIILEWGLGIIAVKIFGLIGVAISHPLVTVILGSLYIKESRRYVRISFWQCIRNSFITSIISASVLFPLVQVFCHGIGSFIVFATFTFAICFVFPFIFDRAMLHFIKYEIKQIMVLRFNTSMHY